MSTDVSQDRKLDRRGALRCAAALVAGAALGGGLSGCVGRGGTRLTLWTLALRPWFDEYMRGQIAEFEAAHPGVVVEWSDVPFDALERKLIAAASAGRAPDVVNMSDLNFARFASLGAFAPLDVAAKERYLPSALELCQLRVRGGGERRVMGLPWYVTPQVSMVNTKLLARAGMTAASMPRTWMGLLDEAGRYRVRASERGGGRGGGGGGFLFSQPLGEESQIPIMMLGEGIVPFSENGSGLIAEVDRPDVVEYVGRWVKAFGAGLLPRAAGTTGHAHLLQMYQDGELAAVSTGPSFLRRIKAAAPEVFAATEIVPGTTGKLGRAHMPVMVLGVSSKSREPGLATALAWHLTSPASQTAFCRLAPIMPSSVASLSDPFFAERDEGGLVEQAKLESVRSLRTATAFTAALDVWPDMRRSLEDGMKRVLLDGADLRRSLEAVNEEWRGLLALSVRSGLDAVPRPGPAAGLDDGDSGRVGRVA